ncbi:MAG: hypothetical protein HS099_05110 [Ardenticatenaceae bacterium]|nr:hypothetical protein [Ardenticatenaceae bacterium]
MSAPQKTRPSLPTAVPPHSLLTPDPNRPTAVPPTTKKHGLHCLTAVPPDSLLTPGRNRPTAVPPPQKSTAVTADGRAPTFTSYAWPKPADGRVRTTKNTAVIANGRTPTFTPYARPKPADGRTPHHKKTRPSLSDGRAPRFTPYARQKPADGLTPTTKKHGRYCRRPCCHIRSLRQCTVALIRLFASSIRCCPAQTTVARGGQHPYGLRGGPSHRKRPCPSRNASLYFDRYARWIADIFK